MTQEGEHAAAPAAAAGPDDAAIQQLVTRLARRSRSGDQVVERATLLAEGSDFGAIEAWILQRGGRPEMPVVSARGGLHADRNAAAAAGTGRVAERYVFPAGSL